MTCPKVFIWLSGSEFDQMRCIPRVRGIADSREHVQDVNLHIQHPENIGWEKTVEAFHAFVHRLKLHGVERVNHNFRLQQNACADGLATYEYYLPVEDIGMWLPCWEEGLGLQGFTAQGWVAMDQGTSWVGANASYLDRYALSCSLYMSAFPTSHSIEYHGGEPH